ncbi:Hypothetical predicted protein [Marmota monax]|uniref:Uncharacterized protein n=1 Tax=Marmota monax TaxID=9995 RepID=A0A5E4CQ50_MARMO|nr:hypothetical protein GHT09_009647 [Marmota monax]VTJ83279.1 Hypothetical predicted protein [Marmota monax]
MAAVDAVARGEPQEPSQGSKGLASPDPMQNWYQRGLCPSPLTKPVDLGRSGSSPGGDKPPH